MKQHGFLILTDITGYTAFLSASELEHAQDILQTIMQRLLLHTTQAPFQFSKLEGDAVFSYVLDGTFKTGVTIIETIEATYAAFRRHLAQMQFNTTCTCKACSNMPNLDLKFFIHHGEFFIQKLSNQKELVSSDVNLVHRLAKNTVTTTSGIKAYALFSDAAITTIDIPEFSNTLTSLTENYEHLGDVQCYIYNLHHFWEQNQANFGQPLTAEEAKIELVYEVPVAPAVLWEYLSHSDTRRYLSLSDTMDITEKKNGRVTAGSIYHCAHGDNITEWYITDWQPFDHLNYTNLGPFNTQINSSFILHPTATGCQWVIRSKNEKTSLMFKLLSPLLYIVFKKMAGDGYQTLIDILIKEAEERNLTLTEPTALSQAEIDAALKSALPTADR